VIGGKLVALGDSFTEGYGDDCDGEPCRSWVHHLVEQERTVNPKFEATNLARYGADLSTVAAQQVPRAVAEGADLATLIAGANDVRAQSWDPQRFAELLRLGVRELQTYGARVVLGNVPDFALTLPVRELSVKLALQVRIVEANQIIAGVACDGGLQLLDFASLPATRDLRNHSRDLIHPNARGYRVVATTIHAELSDWCHQSRSVGDYPNRDVQRGAFDEN